MTNAKKIPEMGVGEARNGAVSFTRKLDSGELLTGTPTVVEEGTSHLAISNVAVNTAQLTINGATVIVGHAVQFHVTETSSGSIVAGRTYALKLTAPTDASPAQMLTGRVKFKAVN